MKFYTFDSIKDLRVFLVGCTTFDGKPFDLEEFERSSPRKLANLAKAINQKREIEFARLDNGNCVCCSKKSEVLLRVAGMELIEHYRIVAGRIIPTTREGEDAVIRTTSETGIYGETAETTAIRGMWGEGRVKVARGELVQISTPEIRDFADPRNRHESSVYLGMWRATMTTRFILNREARPARWNERLYINDDAVEVFGEWEPESKRDPAGHNPLPFWKDIFPLPEDEFQLRSSGPRM